MSDQDQPFVTVHPGDMLTAGTINHIQVLTRQEIAKQIAAAFAKISGVDVDQAKNAHTLDNLTVDKLSQQIVQEALAKVPYKSNYRMFFRWLESPSLNNSKVKWDIVHHNLKAFPLVDIYQLDYFKVFCCTGDDLDDPNQLFVSHVNFYAYHGSEKRLRYKVGTPPVTETVDLEPVGQQAYRIPFREMLELVRGREGFEWDDDRVLKELETDFWQAFLPKEDEFQESLFCHSPWFEKNRDRTVGELHRRGDWENIWFQMQPEKKSSCPQPPPDVDEPPAKTGTAGVASGGSQGKNPKPAAKFPCPMNVQVVHYDFNTLGIGLLEDVQYENAKELHDEDPDADKQLHASVMLLLKV